jgi:two-component system response regulator (stage 0 sporulation protein F)
MKAAKEILVVDDNQGLRKILFNLLTERGYKVTTASDGQDSLNKMEDHNFDLLILDTDMPFLSGIDVLRRMKKRGRNEKIITLGNGKLDPVSVADSIPAVYCNLPKPFLVYNLMNMIESALGLGEADRR